MTLARVWLLTVWAASVVVLPASPSAADEGDIRFAVAQDYPSSTITYNGSASPGSVAYLYRDGHADKYADLVMANLGGGPVVLYGIGGGRFSNERHMVNNSDTDASALQVSDFNSDGIPDIVSGGYTTSRLTVMLGRRDGTFRVNGQYPLQGVWPSQFQIADLNRDGHLDIATAAYLGRQITILLGNGDGTFRTAPSVQAPNLALALLVADLATTSDDAGTAALSGPEALAWASTSNGDSDSIACIAGGLIGSAHPEKNFWSAAGMTPEFEPRYAEEIATAARRLPAGDTD